MASDHGPDKKGLPGSLCAGEGSAAYRRVAEIVAEAARLAREILGPTAEIVWFGSWPRGLAHPRSDIDLAIRCSEGVPRAKVRRLREALDDLRTLYTIQLVDLREAGRLLREEVERYGQPLRSRPCKRSSWR